MDEGLLMDLSIDWQAEAFRLMTEVKLLREVVCLFVPIDGDYDFLDVDQEDAVDRALRA